MFLDTSHLLLFSSYFSSVKELAGRKRGLKEFVNDTPPVFLLSLAKKIHV